MTKTHFNYLLLDPRELHPPHSHHDNLERFENFVAAIFYVGKGKNARSLQHLKEAKDCLRGNAKRKVTTDLSSMSGLPLPGVEETIILPTQWFPPNSVQRR